MKELDESVTNQKFSVIVEIMNEVASVVAVRGSYL